MVLSPIKIVLNENQHDVKVIGSQMKPLIQARRNAKKAQDAILFASDKTTEKRKEALEAGLAERIAMYSRRRDQTIGSMDSMIKKLDIRLYRDVPQFARQQGEMS